MTTSSFKRTISLLIGLLLVVSLVCVSAYGQGSIYKKRHKRARRAVAAVPVIGPTPTNLQEYVCSPGEKVLMRFDYTRNMPDGGFLGNQYTSYLGPNGRVIRTTTDAVQWYAPSPPPAQNPPVITWQYQAQNGSFVCKAVVIGANQMRIDFTSCTNFPPRTCIQ
jgi:hypothetical protein